MLCAADRDHPANKLQSHCRSPRASQPAELTTHQGLDVRPLHVHSRRVREWLETEPRSLVQALLSSHDSVAQADYGPVLPPLPDDLPGDEEAMRIVCLVKNNQPLVRNTLHCPSIKVPSALGASTVLTWILSPFEPLRCTLPLPVH